MVRAHNHILVVGAHAGGGSKLMSAIRSDMGQRIDVRGVSVSEALSKQPVTDCVLYFHSPDRRNEIKRLGELHETFSNQPIIVATDPEYLGSVLQHEPTEVVRMIDGTVDSDILSFRVSSVLDQGTADQRRNPPVLGTPTKEHEPTLGDCHNAVTASAEEVVDWEELSRFYEIVSNNESAFDEKVRRLLTFGQNRLQMDLGYFTRIDSVKNTLQVREVVGEHGLVEHGVEYELADSYCNQAIERDAEIALTIPDVGNSEEIPDATYEKFGFDSFVGTDIVVDGETYGTFCFAARSSRCPPFSNSQLLLVELMSQWIRRELEHREYRYELAETNRELTRTLERIDAAFFSMNEEGNLTYVNETAASVLAESMNVECGADELIGQDLFEKMPESDNPLFGERFQEAMESQRNASFVTNSEPLDGWFEIQVYPDEDGLSVYLTDVTARHEREMHLQAERRKFRSLAEGLRDGVYRADPETLEATYTNEALAQQFGRDDGTWFDDDEHWKQLLHPDDKEWVLDTFADRITSRNDGDLEYRIHTQDGEVRWVHDRFSWERDEDGNVTGLYGIVSDITDRKRREEGLNNLLAVSQRFDHVESKEELYEMLLDRVENTFGCEQSLIRVHDTETGALVPEHSSEANRLALPQPPICADNEWLVGKAFQSGEPIVVGEELCESASDYGEFESRMVLPLGRHGTLSIGSVEPDAFGQEDVAFLELLTDTATSTLDRLDRASEMRTLTRVIDHIGERVFTVGGDGEITFTTGQFSQFVGYDAQQLTDMELTQLIVSEDVPTYDATVADLTNGNQSRKSVEVGIETAESGVCPVELTLAVVNDDGGSPMIAGTVSNIRELVRTRNDLTAERNRFGQFFNNLQDAAVEVTFENGSPIITYANQRFCDTFGYTMDSVVEQELNDLVIPANGQNDDRPYDAKLRNETSVTTEAVRGTTDGLRDFLIRGTPYSQDGESRAFVVYTDITEQKTRERHLKVLHRVLRHNLRNEMMVVMGSAEMLKQQISDESLSERAEILRRNAENVATLGEKAKTIEDIVDRQREGDTQISVDSVIHDAIEAQRSEYPKADFIIGDLSEAAVLGDGHLEIAVKELVENAIVHTDNQDPAVTIEADVRNEDWVDIRIQDNGPGIPDSEWAVISGKTEITQLNHSSGLGLWLTKWIVESVNGRIRREMSDDGMAVVMSLRRP